MKFQRTSKGATIELSDEECEELLGETERNCCDYNPIISAIHSELDEMLTEEGA